MGLCVRSKESTKSSRLAFRPKGELSLARTTLSRDLSSFIVTNDKYMVKYYYTQLFVLLLTIATVNIIRYFNHLNRWISFFLLGIENEDTTLKIPSK